MNHLTYIKPLQPISAAVITAVAVFALLLLALPMFAHAANDDEKSTALQIVERFFESEDETESSSVFDLLPPNFIDQIFDDVDVPDIPDMPGDDDDDNDTTDPEISDIESEAQENSIEVSWQTDEETRGTLYLSETTPVDTDDAAAIDDTWAADHMVEVRNLDPNTTYYALIEAEDKAGNTTQSDEFSVMTKEDEDDENGDDEDTQAPNISNVDATSTMNSMSVMWDTNEEADSELFLSTDSPVDVNADETIHIDDATLTEDHSLTATGLDPDTTYYGIVRSTDDEGNTATSSEFTQSTDIEDTEDDMNAPNIFMIMFDTHTSSIDFSWLTDEPATTEVYTSTSTSFALDDNDVIHTGDDTLTTSHGITVTGLEESTTYHHRLVSVDDEGNQTVSTQFTINTD